MATEFKPNYDVHPGILLREEISQKACISKTIVNEIIKGKRGINAEIAVRLESVLESPARFWLNAQSLYDETIARAKLRQIEISAAAV